MMVMVLKSSLLVRVESGAVERLQGLLSMGMNSPVWPGAG